MLPAMRRAVLFDLDNTLTARRASVERFGTLFLEDFADRLRPVDIEALRSALVAIDMGGYNPRRAADLRQCLEWRETPSEEELDAHWARRLPEATVARPGLGALFEALAASGLQRGVVTNGGVPGQLAKLDSLELRDRLDAVLISDAVGCKKPDPRIFAAACEALSVRPEECWFVGDHPENDVLGAARFGMTAVWIRDEVGGHPWPSDEPEPRHRIAGLGELHPLLQLVGADACATTS